MCVCCVCVYMCIYVLHETVCRYVHALMLCMFVATYMTVKYNSIQYPKLYIIIHGNHRHIHIWTITHTHSKKHVIINTDTQASTCGKIGSFVITFFAYLF